MTYILRIQTEQLVIASRIYATKDLEFQSDWKTGSLRTYFLVQKFNQHNIVANVPSLILSNQSLTDN